MQSLQISFRESVGAFYHAAGKDYVFDQLSAPGVFMLEYGVSDTPINLVQRDVGAAPNLSDGIVLGFFGTLESVSLIWCSCVWFDLY